MRLPQNAENVKKAIETIINGYNFNKIKIFAVVCDEGSNLLRLFQNNAYCLYLYQESKDVVYDQITQSDQLDDKNQSSDEDNDENSENDSNDKLLNDIRETKFDKELDFSIRESNDENEDDYNDDDEYDLTNGSELIKDLNLEIGSTKIYRANCCIHKANIAVRKAIKSNEYVKNPDTNEN